MATQTDVSTTGQPGRLGKLVGRDRQGTIFLLIPALIGIGLLVFSMFMISGEIRYFTNSKVVPGTVTSVQMASQGRGARNVAYYHFTTLDGREIFGSCDVGFLFDKVNPVPIQYIPDDPTTNRINGTNKWGII